MGPVEIVHPVARDPLLAGHFARLFACLTAPQSDHVASEENLLRSLMHILRRHGLARPSSSGPSPYVAKAIERLDSAPETSVSLVELAALSGEGSAAPRLHIPNLEGHLMRTPGSQPLPLPIYPRQLQAEVSLHAPPSPLSFTPSGSPSSPSLRFSDPKFCHNSSLHQTIAYRERPHHSIPISPAPSRRFSRIHS